MLAVEEPLEMRVNGERLAVTMRTPGHDVELASGFLVSEGVLVRAEDLATARYCAGAGSAASGPSQPGAGSAASGPNLPGAGSDGLNSYNVLDVALAPGVASPDPSLSRDFTISSACGVCGKDSIESVITRSHFDVSDDPLIVDADAVLDLPGRLREHQKVFAKTGGLHAAALFDGRTGELRVVREDVGRHNAVDKVIGWALAHDLLPLRGQILQVSGRASFELVQKAIMAGVPMLSAVSAPSSLAVDLAEPHGLTLAGFVRGESMVLYSGADRVSCNDANPDEEFSIATTSIATTRKGTS